jgi:hypothetical protein
MNKVNFGELKACLIMVHLQTGFLNEILNMRNIALYPGRVQKKPFGFQMIRDFDYELRESNYSSHPASDLELQNPHLKTHFHNL